MWPEILIAAGIAFSQLVITWYGVHVSVQDHRIRNAVIIGLIGAAGIGLTVWGAVRSTIAQDHLQAQLDRIQKNTETPPQVTVNVPPVTVPPKHGRIEFVPPEEPPNFLPFRDGEKTMVNLKFKNGGDAPLDGGLLDGTVVTVPINSMNKAFGMYQGRLKPWVTTGTMNPSANPTMFHTFSGPTLDAVEADKLNTTKDALCSLGLMTWEDDTGKYETDSAECLAREPDGGFQWHDLTEDNKETKLK